MRKHTKKQHKFNEKNERGFTLVELMVSLTVFSIVVTISVGTLLVLIDVNAKAQALYSSTTNLSFALDAMSREIRTGYDYYCVDVNGGSVSQAIQLGSTRDCSGEAGYLIAFTRERDGRRFTYAKDGDALVQNIGNTWSPTTITSNKDVTIQAFDLIVTNTASPMADILQPKVDMYIEGLMNNGLDTPTQFNIQTTVTQRRLDI